MTQLRWIIPILFFALIYIEVSVFVGVVNRIGVFFSLLAILLTSLIGMGIARKKGINNAKELKQKLDIGETPLAEVTKNFSYIFAGILFLFPGFVTDIFATILLIPFVQRQLVKRFMEKAKFNAKNRYSQNNEATSAQQITIEGEFSHKDENDE